MTNTELQEILRLHKMWLDGNEGGKRANLTYADLTYADLTYADLTDAILARANLTDAILTGANLTNANLTDANLARANLTRANLARANLTDAILARANLTGANLARANLTRADIDYACWPMWCGSLDVKVDKRIAAQLAYHFCRLDCDDDDYLTARDALVDLANAFHRVDECGRILRREGKS